MDDTWDRTSDAGLVIRARAGEKDAFGALIDRCWPVALRAARTMIRAEELARDLAQEAVLQAYLSLDSLRDPHRFRSWLYGIVLNVCRGYLRSQKFDHVSLEALAGGVAFDRLPFTGAEPDPAEAAEERELQRRVLEAVNALSPRSRAAVLLHYYEGLTVREIAALLGVSVTAVKGRLHKSRQMLRHSLMLDVMAQPIERRQTMPEVKVIDVVQEQDGHNVVVLLDEANRRALPIWIGPGEAMAIAFLAGGGEAPRPMTYAFMARLLEATGTTLEEVRIEQLKNQTFYAVAKVRVDGEPREIDARPSDAIPLALQMGAPIYASEAVLDEGGFRLGDDVSLGAQGRGIQAAVERINEMMSRISAEKPSEEERQAQRQRLVEAVFG